MKNQFKNRKKIMKQDSIKENKRTIEIINQVKSIILEAIKMY